MSIFEKTPYCNSESCSMSTSNSNFQLQLHTEECCQLIYHRALRCPVYECWKAVVHPLKWNELHSHPPNVQTHTLCLLQMEHLGASSPGHKIAFSVAEEEEKRSISELPRAIKTIWFQWLIPIYSSECTFVKSQVLAIFSSMEAAQLESLISVAYSRKIRKQIAFPNPEPSESPSCRCCHAEQVNKAQAWVTVTSDSI